jgi:RNA polymerase sigma-70 factor, ECF subfamily
MDMCCSIENVWGSYSSNLIRYIKSKVQNEYDAEDILQEVFLKLQRSINKLEDESKLSAYIYKVARNSIIDYYRKIKNITFVNKELDDFVADEEDADNLNEEVARCIRKMIITLPEKYQMPVELYDILGKKHKDIADRLNISISGSKTRVQRAREKLKEKLLDCCDFEFDTMGNIIDYKQKKECSCEDKRYRC